MTSNPKKILLISRHDARPDYDTAASMQRALQATAVGGVEYASCFLEEVAFLYDGRNLRATDTRNDQDLAVYDGIFLFGWFKLRKYEEVALAISLYAQARGIKTLNTEALHNRSRGKLSQYVLSALNNVSTAPFVFVIDHEKLRMAIERSSLKYPLIVKSTTASRGKDNYLIRDAASLDRAFVASPTKALVAQPFIPNDGDYRLLVMGGRVRLAIHRLAQADTHLNNTSQGGVARLVNTESLPQSMLSDAVKIAHLLRREVTGVDMIVHKATGEYFFLEANNMPQLSAGSFVEEKITELAGQLEKWLNS